MPELALGTVQFGQAYGVAGRGEPVPEREVRDILACAWGHGIRRLDTAPAYGDIEGRLAGLCGALRFAIVSKIAALPPESDAAGQHVRASVAQSRERLGDRLAGLLFHNQDDLTGGGAGPAWQAAAAAAGAVPLGVSCYDAASLARIAGNFPVGMAQLPGNALDQGIAGGAVPGVEITLRSIFLQGLLLMPPDEAAASVPAARAALERWHLFCDERRLSPLAAAVAVAKGLPCAYCVVGVDSAAQLDEVARAWAEAAPLQAPWLDTKDEAIIDPRRWDRN